MVVPDLESYTESVKCIRCLDDEPVDLVVALRVSLDFPGSASDRLLIAGTANGPADDGGGNGDQDEGTGLKSTVDPETGIERAIGPSDEDISAFMGGATCELEEDQSSATEAIQ